jgi:hypothetical protein
MPTQILAVGTSAADSSDVVVAAGTLLTVALKDAAGPDVLGGATVNVLLKDDGGQYFAIDQLDSSKRALVLAPGTWRFTRVAGASCGVFSG